MKHLKRLTAAICAAMLCITAAPSAVHAEESDFIEASEPTAAYISTLTVTVTDFGESTAEGLTYPHGKKVYKLDDPSLYHIETAGPDTENGFTKRVAVVPDTFALIHKFSQDTGVKHIMGNAASGIYFVQYIFGYKDGKWYRSKYDVERIATCLTPSATMSESEVKAAVNGRFTVHCEDGTHSDKTYGLVDGGYEIMPCIFFTDRLIPEVFVKIDGEKYAEQYAKDTGCDHAYVSMEDDYDTISFWYNEDTKKFNISDSDVLTVNVKDSDSSKVNMYRLYNENSGEHFYTSNAKEKDNALAAGWKDEGIGWTAPKEGDPVYRLYNANGGEHHYTLSAEEKDSLVKAGWKYEGIGWYSDKNKGVPLYRLYNPNAFANNHHYTTSADEKAQLVKAGWQDEHIGWYGVKTK